MAQFPILRLTRAGQDLVGMSQGGGKLIFVRAELGDGQLGETESVEMLHALKHRVMQLPLQGYLNEGNGKARLRFVVDNSSLAAGFFNREIGIVAKMEGGDEQLYAYTNAGNYADYIPSKDTPINSEIIDLHILIGNASHVVLETQNGAYATKIELEEHRTAAELDHPEKSVHKKHLAFEVYDKAEADGRVNVKVNKSGDTMTGNLMFVESDNTHDSIFPSHYFHNLHGGDAVYMHAFPSHPAIARSTRFEFRTADGTQDKWTAHVLNSDGFTTTCVRSRGDSGFYFQDHGGGWYMSDNDWIRAWNNKSVYTGGKIKADGGFEGALHGRADSAGNSDTLDGQSLQWIIDQINAAKTGIVAGNLAENGWVKFANGLIVQWGAYAESMNVNDDWRYYPISFPNKIVFYSGTIIDNAFNAQRYKVWFKGVDRSKFTLNVGPDEVGDSSLYACCLFIGY